MKKALKTIARITAGIMLLGNMAAGIPVAEAEELNMWKFDFGAENTSAKEGYVLVTPDMHIINNENRPYGFIGTNEKDYRLHGGRIDGFDQVEGQQIKLVAGDGGIGSVGITDESVKDFNSGDYYPVRFAIKVPDDTYYRVKATVTTLDPTRPAKASLYTERKHPLFTEKTIAAGKSEVAEFTVRVTPVYYEKSDPKGLIADGYLSVCVLGENAALAELEVEQIPSAPTLWILGDSTVTDGGGGLPFFPLSNYTGVGTGVTKYLPGDIAMVNEGEGGLSAHDNSHFNVVKDRIKEGDYLWVEYGHNHKSDGVAGYESAIGKYYDICKKVGATLILVGPIDRINSYDANTNVWHSSLKGFSDAAKKFVDDKLSENPDDKIAFVDLNAPSLEWFGEITKSGIVNNETVTNAERLVHFYFQAPRGAKDVDHTHPNDRGAENLAYLFFENADSEAYPALKPLLTRFEAGEAETPTLVKGEIVNMGYPANNAWPYYNRGVRYEYPLTIRNVNINQNNQIESINCQLMDKSLLTSYAAGFVEVSGNVYQTTIESHIDNSAANDGSVYTVEFAKDNLPVVGEDDYRVYMAGVDMADNDRPLVGEKPFSADYSPQKYSAYILANPDGNIETFDYYGSSDLFASGDWAHGGSLRSAALGEEPERSFVNLVGDGAFSLDRALQQLSGGTGSSGRYDFELYINVKENEGDVTFALANGWRNTAPYIQGESIELFTIKDDNVTLQNTSVGTLRKGEWEKVSCTLDMDEGVISARVNDTQAVLLPLPKYQTFSSPEVQSMYHFVINASGGKTDIKLSNLFGARCNLYDRVQTTINVATEGSQYGGVSIDGNAASAKSVNAGETVTVSANANDGGRFVGWYHDGQPYSEQETLVLRMYKDLNLTARFLEQTPQTDVTVNYIDNSGKMIKSEIVSVNSAGRTLHEEMKFELDERCKEPLVIQNGEYKDVYFFAAADKATIESLGAKGMNTINLVFNYDGLYLTYEDFSTVNDAWGFDKEASKGDGVIHLLTGVGTSNRVSSVKTLDAAVADKTKLTVRFDWKNDVDTSKGRNSSFDLLDNTGEYIFSISAKGKDGISYGVGKFADTVISNNWEGVNDWYSISVSMDFEKGVAWGTILNKNTGKEITIAPMPIAAKNLGTVSATYGYSSASQQLDAFMIRDDEKSARGADFGNVEVVKQLGTSVTVKIDGKESGKYFLIAAVYNDNELVGITTKNIIVDENTPKEITFDVKYSGDVKVFMNS